MKKNVFCDTMIWYYISKGDVQLDWERYNYYGTGINIADFLSSDKHETGEDRRSEMKKAIIAMGETAKDVICVDPLTAAASNLLGIPITDREHKEYQKAYKALIDLANGSIEKIVGPGIDALIEQKSNFQKYAVDTKKQFNIKFREKKFTQDQKGEYVEGNVANWLLGNFNKLYLSSYSMEDVKDWDSVILFIKTYKQFILDVQKQEPEANSMIDNLQLLYIRIGSESLVWTTESKLLKKIRKQFSSEECKNIIYQDHYGEDYKVNNKF